MQEFVISHRSPPKLGLTRDEAAKAIGQSAVTVDRLTKRGLLIPSRATRRPIYPVWEIERFLRETTTVLPIGAPAAAAAAPVRGGRTAAGGV